MIYSESHDFISISLRGELNSSVSLPFIVRKTKFKATIHYKLLSPSLLLFFLSKSKRKTAKEKVTYIYWQTSFHPPYGKMTYPLNQKLTVLKSSWSSHFTLEYVCVCVCVFLFALAIKLLCQ